MIADGFAIDDIRPSKHLIRTQMTTNRNVINAGLIDPVNYTFGDNIHIQFLKTFLYRVCGFDVPIFYTRDTLIEIARNNKAFRKFSDDCREYFKVIDMRLPELFLILLIAHICHMPRDTDADDTDFADRCNYQS